MPASGQKTPDQWPAEPAPKPASSSLSPHLLVAWLLILALLPALPARADSFAAIKDRLADLDLNPRGFLEARSGWRLDRSLNQRDATLAETRLQLELDRFFTLGSLKLKTDFVADGVEEEARARLREGNLLLSPGPGVDIKAGRQILAWGTGDLLFINDVFPKDWISFFIGRESEYLKKPSDAVRASFFGDKINLDLAWMAGPNHSAFIDGSRLSYWNPTLGRPAGRDAVLAAGERNRFLADRELAIRLFRTIGAMEYALYGYHGFWSTPEGMEPASSRLTFPRLAVYGGSIRGPLAGGIASGEAGYYLSRDDREGNDPLIRNSEWRLLAGFERELARDLTAGLQYYLEWKQDHHAYLRTLPAGLPPEAERRQVLTLRLTRLALNHHLRLSWFSFYSPTDRDGYLRPSATYQLSDHWLLEAGGNIFFGSRRHTFFGQFQENSNLYGAVRRSF